MGVKGADATSGPAFNLGPRIRAERVAANISLRELARRIEVSASLLSQIERGLAQPSVSTLWAVVAALDFSLDSLFDPPAEPGATRRESSPTRLLRAADRPVIELDGHVRWERLTPSSDPDVVFAFVTYEPHQPSEAVPPAATHRGREYGYLVSGRLLIEADGMEYRLGRGDSIVLDSQLPHRFRAIGKTAARAVWWNLESPR
ncbi:MAG TPA: cupin domain-containing protein [Acidothermaceae bacterium]